MTNILQELTNNDRARIRAATAIRQLAHEVVRADASTEQLISLAEAVEYQGEILGVAPAKVRNRFRFESADQMPVPLDGDEFSNSLERPMSGLGNPWSIPLHVFRRGDKVVTEVTLGPGFEGAPERAHGGIVAAIFDDLLGFVQLLNSRIAFTASLTVNYLAGTPVGEPLTFSAWVDRIEGKKLFLAGECHLSSDVGGEPLTTCEALFIDAAEFFGILNE